MRTLARSYALSALIAVVVAVPATAAAQVFQPGTQVPPRDRAAMPTTGNGAIRGRVVDGVSGAAVPRARVRVMGGGPQRPGVTTDAAGRFEFTKLPAGTFTLGVEKSTYMPSRYPTPGQTLRSLGRPLLLQAGQSIDTITIPLFRGAAISGHVMDANGDLVDSAQVSVLRLSGSGGGPTPRSGGSTNDLGEYRLGRLEPGNYVVVATARRVGQGEPLAPDAEPPPQPVPSSYPGVNRLDLAQPIRVERGQTVGDIDITLTEAVPAVVSGTAVGEDGQPLTTGGFVMARAMVKDMPFMMDTSGGTVGPDGRFQLTLAPGDYVLEARTMSPGAGSDRLGLERVSVTGNVAGLTIQIGRAATASGRVIFEGTSELPPTPQQVRFQLFGYDDGMACRPGRMTVSADWTFTIEGLSGTCSVIPQSGIGRWMLKALQINGREIDGQSITFEAGQQLRNVEAVFTDRRTNVTFRVSDEHGQTTREYAVLLFPISRQRIQPSMVRTLVPPPDELIAAAALTPGRAPSDPRREAISGVRAGDYYAVALDDIGSEDARDPSILARLIPAATRVTVSEGASVQVVLRRQALADVLRH